MPSLGGLPKKTLYLEIDKDDSQQSNLERPLEHSDESGETPMGDVMLDKKEGKCAQQPSLERLLLDESTVGNADLDATEGECRQGSKCCSRLERSDKIDANPVGNDVSDKAEQYVKHNYDQVLKELCSVTILYEEDGECFQESNRDSLSENGNGSSVLERRLKDSKLDANPLGNDMSDKAEQYFKHNYDQLLEELYSVTKLHGIDRKCSQGFKHDSRLGGSDKIDANQEGDVVLGEEECSQ
ncbi:MAG: hypothetical protein QS748_12285 [Candidatus Endonucleobacter bathymodioli]|uniref:Uncharacterized protein n=1 Tax=Candidatus Endonucleibacter bathymodioli TaxID=539814 RepID=A0AA90NXX1_9GAMM|nr:hypothetical protein [Candidatus Endonucleobacter bathymodioli]